MSPVVDVEGEALAAIPVIALTGHLGAGKTTLLNHLLHHPGTRIGVIVNDFGDINIDAGLVAGQVDEPASIAGGCICCLPDGGGLDEALGKLADPARRLDAIVVEASGLADPVAIARLIGFSEIRGPSGRAGRRRRRREPLRHRGLRPAAAGTLRRGLADRRQQARPGARAGTVGHGATH